MDSNNETPDDPKFKVIVALKIFLWAKTNYSKGFHSDMWTTDKSHDIWMWK